jgi:hypothetical protein
MATAAILPPSNKKFVNGINIHSGQSTRYDASLTQTKRVE